MVAMNSVMGGWLTSLRSTKRSVARPTRIITTKAPMMAAHIGMPLSIRPTTASAAKYTIAPCAKLNTPEAL
jgi:hypothetical protein